MKLIPIFLLSLITGFLGLPCVAMDKTPLLSATDSEGSHSRGDSGDSSSGDDRDAKTQRNDAYRSTVVGALTSRNIVSADPRRDNSVPAFRPWICTTQSANGNAVTYIPCRLSDADAKKMGAKNKGYLTNWYMQITEHDSAKDKVATSIEQMPDQYGSIRSFVALPKVNVQVWTNDRGTALASPLHTRFAMEVFRQFYTIEDQKHRGLARSLIAISDHEIAIGRNAGVIELWDMKSPSGKLLRRLGLANQNNPRSKLSNSVIALAFLKTKNALASCTKGARSSSIHVWHLGEPKATRMDTVSDTQWNHIKPTDDGNAIISVSANGRLSLWDTQTGACLLSPTITGRGQDYIEGLQLKQYNDDDSAQGDVGIVPHSVEPLDNNGTVAVVHGESLQIVDLRTAEKIERDAKQTNYNIHAVARTPQGQLVTTANARTVTLWHDTRDAKERHAHCEAAGD